MNFFQNLFGAINTLPSVTNRFPGTIQFAPTSDNGATITLKGIEATWLGLKNSLQQKKAYESCFALASVVDKLAELDITGERKLLRYKGKGKKDLATSPYAIRLNALLDNPNPFQSWSQFRGQQVVYKKIFGFCPVLPIVPAGMSPENAVSMINLPPWLFAVVPNSNVNIMSSTKVTDYIKQYVVNFPVGNPITLTADQIFILEDSFMLDENQQFLLPQSRLVGLDMAISNFCAAMEADNVLLRKKGPLGFISHDAAAVKDSVAGYLPMQQHEKVEIQEALQQYGVSWDQYQYAISRTAIKWNPMSYDVNQLGIKDTVVAAEKAICHRYGFPYVLYEEIDATYANGENAALYVYQNNVIPNNNKDIQKYSKFFKTVENNCQLIVDYSDLPVLQDDKLVAAQAAYELDEALLIEYNNNIITKNQWLEARGYDSVDDGNNFKSAGNTDPLAVKLGVGGIQALTEVLANPSLDDEAKKNCLVILFGLSPEDASKMISKSKNTQNVEETVPPKNTGAQA